MATPTRKGAASVLTVRPGPSAGTISTILVVTGSILYSSKSLFVKHLMGEGASSGEILSLRLAWAAPFYLAVIFWNLARKPVRWTDMLKMAGLGWLGFWLAPRLNFHGLGSTSAGLERILIQSSTVFVILFVAIRFRRPPGKVVTISVIVCYAGMVLAMVGRDEGRAFADPTGALFILGAACAWALFVVGVGRLQKRLGVGLSTSVGMAAAAIPAVAESIVSGHQALLVSVPGGWIAPMLGLVAMGTLVPSFLAQAGLARVGPVRSSILALSGPAILPLLAAFTLGESMPWQQIAGLSVVLASCAAMSLRDG
jgi:drug/metabolite transporter (DMT)-like permease